MSTEGPPAAQLATPSLTIGAIGRASVTYALGGFAYKAVALFSVPILARLLTPAELGVLDLAAVCASIVGLAASVGIDQAIPYVQPRLGARAGEAWGSAAALVLAIAVPLAIAAVVFREPLASLLTGTSRNAPVIAAAGLYGSIIAVSSLALTAIRLTAPPRRYALGSFLIVSAEMAAALLVAWLVEMPVPWMVLAWSLGALVVVVPMLARLVPRWERPRVPTMQRLLAFGAPLVPAALAWVVGDAWIRATLAREAELTALGEYGIASRVASVLMLAVAGFGVAWHPYLYRTKPADVLPRAMAAFAPVLLALGGLGAVVTVLAPEIIAIVAGAAYANARQAVPTLAAGAVALGGFVLVSGIVGSSGSTRRTAAAAVLGMVVMLVVAPMLVPAAGLAGAGATSLIGNMAAAVTLILTEQQLRRAPGALPVVATAVAVAVLFVVAAFLMPASLPARLLVAGAVAVVTVGAGRVLIRAGQKAG